MNCVNENIYYELENADYDTCWKMNWYSEHNLYGLTRTKFCEITAPSGESWHQCFPNKCPNEDIADWFLEKNGAREHLAVWCEGDGYPLSWASVMAIAVLISLVLLVFMSLAYSMLKDSSKNETINRIVAKADWLSGVLRCFDPIENSKNLLSFRGGSTAFFDAIRSLTMLWIILGHMESFNWVGGYKNYEYLNLRLIAPESILNRTYTLGVDTFLWMGGFLCTTSVIKSVTSAREQYQKPLYVVSTTLKSYLLRWFRLTPLLAFIIMMAFLVIPHMGSGPFWNHYFRNLNKWASMSGRKPNCEKWWWTNFLYINNLYDPIIENCLGWAWYLTVDFQFAILTPVVVIPLVAYNRFVSVVTFLSLVVFLGVAIYVAATTPLSTNLSDISYKKTQFRFAPLLHGILCKFFVFSVQGNWSWLLSEEVSTDVIDENINREEDGALEMAFIEDDDIVNETDNSPTPVPVDEDEDKLVSSNDIIKDKVSEPTRAQSASCNTTTREFLRLRLPTTKTFSKTWVRVLMYSLAAFLLSFVIYRHRRLYFDSVGLGKSWSLEQRKAHALLDTSCWGLGLSLLSIPMALGHGGLIKGLMSSKVWSTMGKLTFGAYLIHPLVLIVWQSTLTAPNSYSDFQGVMLFIATTCSSYFCSYVTWLLLEKPLAEVVNMSANILNYWQGVFVSVFIILFLCFVGVVQSDPNPDPLSSTVYKNSIITSTGQYIGNVLTDVRSFKGIQYANSTRFSPPRPLNESNSGAQRAASEGPQCWNNESSCFTLDIFRPRIQTTNLPIIISFDEAIPGVYIDHSAIVSTSQKQSNNAFILINVRHRIGVLGYFGGRNGYEDQLLAIKWIAENAGNIGGSNTLVVMGDESALLHQNNPLVSKIISLRPTSLLSPSEAMRADSQLLTSLNCSNPDITRCPSLWKLSVSELIGLSNGMNFKPSYDNSYTNLSKPLLVIFSTWEALQRELFYVVQPPGNEIAFDNLVGSGTLKQHYMEKVNTSWFDRIASALTDKYYACQAAKIVRGRMQSKVIQINALDSAVDHPCLTNWLFSHNWYNSCSYLSAAPKPSYDYPGYFCFRNGISSITQCEPAAVHDDHLKYLFNSPSANATWRKGTSEALVSRVGHFIYNELSNGEDTNGLIEDPESDSCKFW